MFYTNPLDNSTAVSARALLHYTAPAVQAISPSMFHTTGAIVTITGTSFGSTIRRVSFRQWLLTLPPNRALLAAGAGDVLRTTADLPCVPVLAWEHNKITCVAPQGRGDANSTDVIVDVYWAQARAARGAAAGGMSACLTRCRAVDTNGWCCVQGRRNLRVQHDSSWRVAPAR